MFKKVITSALCAIVGLSFTPIGSAAPKKTSHPLIGKSAPKWEAEEWKNLPKGKNSLSAEDFKGKVVYLYNFQSWCPGCHSHGFPTLAELVKKYKDDDTVAFATIQTVFEGGHVNTPEAAWRTAKKFKLDIPVGHSGGADGESSKVMEAYQTRGTPWTVIIDPDGKVRYSDFHISVKEASRIIDHLKP